MRRLEQISSTAWACWLTYKMLTDPELLEAVLRLGRAEAELAAARQNARELLRRRLGGDMSLPDL